MNEQLRKLYVFARTGFQLLAVKYREQCWCGNSYTNARMISERNCTMTCSGDSSQTCGGSYAMEIYYTVPRGEACVCHFVTWIMLARSRN